MGSWHHNVIAFLWEMESLVCKRQCVNYIYGRDMLVILPIMMRSIAFSGENWYHCLADQPVVITLQEEIQSSPCIWHLWDGILHPDTNEKIFMPFRMSGKPSGPSSSSQFGPLMRVTAPRASGRYILLHTWPHLHLHGHFGSTAQDWPAYGAFEMCLSFLPEQLGWSWGIHR